MRDLLNEALWDNRRGHSGSMPANLTNPGPLLGFVSDEPPEGGGRALQHCTTQVGEPPAFILELARASIDLLVELVDDLSGRVLGRADTIPRAVEPVTDLA